MHELIKTIGEQFPITLPLLYALTLGVIYIFAFIGAVYYGIDLCEKFKNSAIGKFSKLIIAATPIALVCYAPLLKLYPQELITISSTLGILEIFSLIYLMFWQSIYLILKALLYGYVIVFYSLMLAFLASFLEFVPHVSIVLIAATAILFYQIKFNPIDEFRRLSNNFQHNIKCLFSIKN